MPATAFETMKMQELMEDFHIPEHCRDALRRFLLDHVPTGSFLQNLLSNNLSETYATADSVNFHVIGNYVKFLYNCAPAGCWGSPERYRDWITVRK